MRALAKWLVCVAVLVVTAGLFPQYVHAPGGILALVAAATVLWAVNLLLRPLLQLVSLPVTIVTFGIFSIVVNALMVALADACVPGLQITRFWVCLFIAVCVSAANWIFVAK
ncbi:MAG: phage holin family protein [Clostridia bacterium]|nr:phage holin family protein [Clostridia bacterium]